jgi:ABC-2 type transport system permease protein
VVSIGHGVGLIARREFVERGRSRVFVGVLLGSMLLILAGMFAVSLLGRPVPSATVGVVESGSSALADEVQRAAASSGVQVVVVPLPTAQEATAAVRDGAVVAALVAPDTIVAEGAPPAPVEAVLRAAATASAREQAAAELGLDAADVDRVLDPVEVQVRNVAPVASTAGDPLRQARGAAAFASVVLLFILVMAFGQFVGSAVVEEKQSRVAELVLAKCSTAAMIVGKVLGIGGLGLVQLGVLGLTYLVGLRAFGTDSAGLALFRLGFWPVVWLAVWFVVGYAMYSFLFATMGATVSRLEDLQSLTYVPSVLLLPAYVVAGLSLAGGPSALLAPMSMLPWWAPLLMPFRMVTGDAPVWQVLVGFAGSLAFIAFLVWFGARVYRGAALRTGGRVSLREAYRAG